MNNLFGLFHRDGSPVEHALLERMARAAPCKPDGNCAVWRHENIALGVIAHPTTPEAKFEILPLVHSANAYILTSGARLDNRAELCDAFAIPHAERAATPDSALLLRAYEKWGRACCDHLIGDWAFALWDARTIAHARVLAHHRADAALLRDAPSFAFAIYRTGCAQDVKTRTQLRVVSPIV